MWFKRTKWLYVPRRWQGWVIAVLGLLFCLNTLVIVDLYSHSFSDVLYGIFPYWVGTGVIYAWIASRTSK